MIEDEMQDVLGHLDEVTKCSVCGNFYNNWEYDECEKCPVEIVKKDGLQYHTYQIGGTWVYKWSDEHKALLLYGKYEDEKIILLKDLIPDG